MTSRRRRLSAFVLAGIVSVVPSAPRVVVASDTATDRPDEPSAERCDGRKVMRRYVDRNLLNVDPNRDEGTVVEFDYDERERTVTVTYQRFSPLTGEPVRTDSRKTHLLADSGMPHRTRSTLAGVEMSVVRYAYGDALDPIEIRWGDTTRRVERDASGRAIGSTERVDGEPGGVRTRYVRDGTGRLIRTVREFTGHAGRGVHESLYEYVDGGTKVRVRHFVQDTDRPSETRPPSVRLWELDPDGSVRRLHVTTPAGVPARVIEVEYGEARGVFCNFGLFGRFSRFR